MTAYGTYDFRDPSLEDYINFEHALDVIQRKGGTKQDLKIIQMECTMPAGATMISASSGRTDVFDGTGTAATVFAISSDNTQDKAAGTGALTVTVFGTDANDLYAEDTITLNGTTEVEGTTEFKRLIAAKLASCGSGGVGVGNVTITDTGQAHTYLTIPAGQAASAQAGFMYIPDGYKGMILDFSACYVQTADAASVLLTEGINVWIRNFGTSTVTEDEIRQFSYTNIDSHSPRLRPQWNVQTGGDDVYIDVYHQSIDTDNTANVMHYDIIYVVWKEAA